MLLVVCRISRDVICCEAVKRDWCVKFDPCFVSQMSVGLLLEELVGLSIVSISLSTRRTENIIGNRPYYRQLVVSAGRQFIETDNFCGHLAKTKTCLQSVLTMILVNQHRQTIWKYINFSLMCIHLQQNRSQ